MNAGNRPASLRHLDHNCSENGNLAVSMPSPGGRSARRIRISIIAATVIPQWRRPSPTGPQAKTKSARPKPCIGFGRAVLSISSGQYRTMDTAEALPGVPFHPQQFPPKKQLGQAFKTLARLPRQEYLPLGYAIFIAVNAQASSADSTDARPYSVPPYDDIVILSGSAFRSHWTAVSAKARTTGSASP